MDKPKLIAELRERAKRFKTHALYMDADRLTNAYMLVELRSREVRYAGEIMELLADYLDEKQKEG